MVLYTINFVFFFFFFRKYSQGCFNRFTSAESWANRNSKFPILWHYCPKSKHYAYAVLYTRLKKINKFVVNLLFHVQFYENKVRLIFKCSTQLTQ